MTNQIVDANKKVLDPCSGSRMFYFDRANASVIYADRRRETHTLCDGRTLNVCPDEIVDYRSLPYADEEFNLVVLDPPHLVYAGRDSWLAKKYGTLDKATWHEEITAAFAECWRVLTKSGTLIFKWNETQIPLRDVLPCAPVAPLFGHTTTRNLLTHWCVFYKGES